MKFFTLVLLTLFFSCHKNISNTKTVSNIESTKNNRIEKTGEIELYDINKAEVMLEEDLSFNGILGRFFKINEFENVFGKPDSIVLVSKTELCSYIFENEDGSKDLKDKFFYKDGSRFENSKNEIAVDEFRFTKNNFIKFKNIILNSETTKEDLKKYFPYAMKHIENIDVQNDGKMEVIQLREDKQNKSEGHILLFIKYNKLKYMHWWLPC
jgi:hypothetical protein